MTAPTELIWADDSYASERLEAAIAGSKSAIIRVQAMKAKAASNPPTQIAIRPFPYPGHRTCADWLNADERTQICKPRKSHCRRGHLRTPESTFERKVHVKGKDYIVRECRICHSQRNVMLRDGFGKTGRKNNSKWTRFLESRDSDAVRSTETEGLGSIRTGKRGPKASPNISTSNPTETGE